MVVVSSGQVSPQIQVTILYSVALTWHEDTPQLGKVRLLCFKGVRRNKCRWETDVALTLSLSAERSSRRRELQLALQGPTAVQLD